MAGTWALCTSGSGVEQRRLPRLKSRRWPGHSGLLSLVKTSGVQPGGGGILLPRGLLAMSGDISKLIQLGGGMLLASSQ